MQFAAKVLGEGSLAMSANLVKMMMVEVREVMEVTEATNLSLSQISLTQHNIGEL